MPVPSLLTTLLLLSPAPARGAPGAPASCRPLDTTSSTTAASVWRGAWALNTAASDDPAKAVADARPQRRLPRRSRAASAGHERLTVAQCLQLAEDGGVITVASERGVVWRVRRDGSAESGAPRAGGRALPATVSDQAITITGGAGDGDEASRYELRRSADGRRLELFVRVIAKRLDHPVDYRLVYDAVGGAAGGGA